jgi:hypothetical protein
VGPRAGLDARVGRKILCPCRGSNLDRPARSLSYRGSEEREINKETQKKTYKETKEAGMLETSGADGISKQDQKESYQARKTLGYLS